MLELFYLPFMQRALLSGLLLGVSLSLLGVLVVLKKSAFFGDAIAHFSFAGIALGFLLSLDPIATAVGVSVILALGIGYLQQRATVQSLDTIIGIFFSGAAALGIVTIGLLHGYQPDLFQYLFGDIIAISQRDVTVSLLVTIIVVVTLMLIRKPLLKSIFHREMAEVNGVPVATLDYVFMILLAVTTSLSIKIIGILLVPALLVIPAAAAKNIAQSLRSLIVLTLIIGVVSVIGGLIAAYLFNIAAGAAIVLFGITFFFLTLFSRTQ